MTVCYRHPDQETGVSCSNCGRPICPDCMTPTPVGMRCPECSKQKTEVRRLNAERPLAQRAPVTMAIIAVNVAVFVIGMVIDGGSATGGSLGKLQREGALYGPLVADGEWYRIVTSGFLHSGLWHVALNMFLIYIIGTQVEESLGRVRYAVVYFGALLAGSLGSMLLSPDSVVVGASGAGFGLMGAYAVLAWARGFSVWQSGIGGLILLNVLFTFAVPNIAIGGHLGGLAGGALLGFLFIVLDERRHVFGKSQVPAIVIGVAFGLACFVGTVLKAQAAFPFLV